jgi:hypothetical protein
MACEVRINAPTAFTIVVSLCSFCLRIGPFSADNSIELRDYDCG